MRERAYGRIVLTASTAFLGEGTAALGYVAGKGANVSLGQSLGHQGAPLGIKVNTITPFGFSRMVSSAPKFSPADLERRARLGPPAAVARETLALVHESCPVSACLYTIGNGRIARWFFGETQGLEQHGASAEDMLARWDTVMDTADWILVDGPSTSVSDRMFERVEALVGAAR